MNILLATLLFIVLSPGLIVTLPPAKGGIVASQATSNVAVVVHAVIFFILAKLTTEDSSGNIAWPWKYLVTASDEISTRRNKDGKLKDTIKVANLVATVLFIVMSPGVLLTVPPDEGSLVMSQDTNILAIMVHSAAFYVVLKTWEYWAKQGDGNLIQLANEQLLDI